MDLLPRLRSELAARLREIATRRKRIDQLPRGRRRTRLVRYQRKVRARAALLRRAIRRANARPRIVTAEQLGCRFAYVWGTKGTVFRFAGHYSGGPKATSIDDTIAKARSFHAFHLSLGWGGCSYEYVVGPGVIVAMNPTDRKSAAVAANNTGMAGVCVPGTTGDRIDPVTRRTLEWLIENAHTSRMPRAHRMPRPIRDLDCRGHNEFPGQSTSCPGEYLPTYKELFRG